MQYHSRSLPLARLRTVMDIVDVARAAGLSSATVSKVENGWQIPIVVTVRALAEALKQPIWFLGCYEVLPEVTLGQRIRKARLYEGLTKKEFADRIRVNEKRVQSAFSTFLAKINSAFRYS